MSLPVETDRRTAREIQADEAYCRLRMLLQDDPAVFIATRDGLAVEAAAAEAHLFAPDADCPLPRAPVIATARADGWLLRITTRYWLLHPEAFDCTEEPPAGVRDHRWDGIERTEPRIISRDAEGWV